MCASVAGGASVRYAGVDQQWGDAARWSSQTAARTPCWHSSRRMLVVRYEDLLSKTSTHDQFDDSSLVRLVHCL